MGISKKKSERNENKMEVYNRTVRCYDRKTARKTVIYND